MTTIEFLALCLGTVFGTIAGYIVGVWQGHREMREKRGLWD